MRLPSVTFRARSFLLVTAVLLPLVGTACTTYTGPKAISGILRGADGSYVDAMLGFDIIDAQGHAIKADGSPATGGYGALLRLNYCVSAAGTTDPTTSCGGQRVTGSWSLDLPSNAVRVYVEAYPKGASTIGWIDNYRGYTGPNPGVTDESTFGMSYRRSVPVLLAGASGVDLTMPTNCGKPAGSTGSISGRIFQGNTLWVGAAGTVNAWSTEPDNAPILGMNTGSVSSAGTFRITSLQGSSHYTIVATIGGIQRQWLAGGQPFVTACHNTLFDLHF